MSHTSTNQFFCQCPSTNVLGHWQAYLASPRGWKKGCTIKALTSPLGYKAFLLQLKLMLIACNFITDQQGQVTKKFWAELRAVVLNVCVTLALRITTAGSLVIPTQCERCLDSDPTFLQGLFCASDILSSRLFLSPEAKLTLEEHLHGPGSTNCHSGILFSS